MSRSSKKPSKPPLYLQPPFDVDQWVIDKGVNIEPVSTNGEYLLENSSGFFTAGAGTIMTYKKHDWFYTHSRNLDGQILNDGSSYQFEGGERVILYGLVFIGYVLPGQLNKIRYEKLDLSWQVLVESYLLNDLEYYDLLYE